jgi:lauroyl/myristoyl acyltransferase
MYLTGYRRSVTMDNLTHAFPEKSSDELRRIARGAYRNYGRAILEMLWAGGQPADALKGRSIRVMHIVHQALNGAAA